MTTEAVIDLRRSFEELRQQMDVYDQRLVDVTRTAADLAHVQKSLRSALLAVMDEIDRLDPVNAPRPPAPAAPEPVPADPPSSRRRR